MTTTRRPQRVRPPPTAALVAARVGALALGSVAGCVAELPAPPQPPVVYAAPSLVNEAGVVLRGLKEASTEIVLSNDEVVVPLDEETTWTTSVSLVRGTNAFSLAAADALGRRSSYTPVSIVLDDEPPIPPDLDAVPPTTLQDELRLAGTKSSGDRVVVNGAVRPTGAVDDLTFALDLDLVPGANVVRVATLDAAGNESELVELQVERADVVPFTVVTPPATVASATLQLTGTRGAGVEVVLGSVVVVPAAAAAGAWNHAVTLVPGANHLDLSGRIELEPVSELNHDVDVFYDDGAATLTIATPTASAFIDEPILDIAGTANDATAISVEVCVGACASDSDFTAATLTGTDYAATIDLSGRGDLPDGAFADVVVRATDAVGQRASTSVTVLIGRMPVTLVAAGAVDLVSGPFYVEGRAFLDATGAAWVQLDADGPPWQADLERISDAAAVSASAPQLGSLVGGVAAVVLEDSPAASATAGAMGLVYVEVTPAGATRAVVRQGDVGDEVGSADVAVTPAGSLIAFSRGDEVLVVVEDVGGMAFGAPLALSDATTVAPAHVRLARLGGGAVVVTWQETSDRDGTLDDVDVVARVLAADGSALGPVVLLSSGAGDATVPEVVDLDGDTALLGWLQGGAAVIGAGDVAALTAGTGPTTVDASAVTGSGTASALALAADAGRLVVCWLDDGGALVGANAPGLVVRSSSGGPASLGSATVYSSAPVSAAACGLDGTTVHATWISSGTMYLQPRVLP